MNIVSVNRIISAKDYGGSGKRYILSQVEARRKRGIVVNIHGIDEPRGEPVSAYVWQGQWIATCEHCSSSSFVDPEEPVFFCFGCGNRANDGYCRPVIVPAEWREIEQTLLERPVNDVAGLTDLERVGMAKPVLYVEREVNGEKVVLPLPRSWKPGETLADLHEQQDEAIRAWKSDLKRGQDGV